MTRWLWIAGNLAAWAALLSVGQDAGAAVRICGTEVTGFASAPTEIEARRQALKDWKSKAAAIGENYTNWRISAHRQLTCRPGPAQEVHCFAVARPCIIDQAPNTFELRRNRRDI